MHPKSLNSAKLEHIFGRVLTALVITQLYACSLLQPTPSQTPIAADVDWQELRQALFEFEEWTLVAKIGVRTPDQNVTAAINRWEQHGEIFDIQLSSTFFGLGQSRVVGNPAYIVLEESGEEPLGSNDPDGLLLEALGFPLPITALSHWIKGIPHPDSPFDAVFHDNGLLKSLSQNNWELEFDQYTQPPALDLTLPGRIRLVQGPSRITLVIKEWAAL